MPDTEVDVRFADVAVPGEIDHVARSGVAVVLEAEGVVGEYAVSDLRRWRRGRAARGTGERLLHTGIHSEMPALAAPADDRDDLQDPEVLLADREVARKLEVDTPVQPLLSIMRRDVLQLGAIAFAHGRAGCESERKLEAEFPVMPDAVRVLRHDAQRTGARLVDVRLERLRAVRGELVGEHLDLVRRSASRTRQREKHKREQRVTQARAV